MIALNINWFLATKGGRSSICPRHRIYRSGRRYSRRLRANRVSVGSMWIYLASDGNHGSAVAGPRFKHVKGNQEPLRPKAAWLKSSRVGFFLRVCAGRRDAFFSNWSACRCALSAFVRFSDTRIVSHRSCSLGYSCGFQIARYLSLGAFLAQ